VRTVLQRQTNVDDVCTGADIIPELLKLQSDLVFISNQSGLELKKWASNTPSALETVPAEDRMVAPLLFETVEGYGTKLLGLECFPLRFNFHPVSCIFKTWHSLHRFLKGSHDNESEFFIIIDIVYYRWIFMLT